MDAAVTQKNIGKLQKLENGLLDAANDKLQVFASHEFGAMKRLQADRNLCMHPSFAVEDKLYQPTQEVVRPHIVQRCNIS